MIDLNSLGFSGWEYVLLGAIVFIFLIASAITTGIIYFRKKWNFTYVLLEDIGGLGYVPTRRGRCKLLSVGDSGEEVFFIRGLNKYRTAYNKRIGKNQIAWAVGQDGYWYNITFGNLNKKLMELGVFPVDRDMRYASSAMRKYIDNTYKPKNAFEKWKDIITYGILFFCIVALCITIIYSLNKIKEGQEIMKQVNDANLKVLEMTSNILKSIDNINFYNNPTKPIPNPNLPPSGLNITT